MKEVDKLKERAAEAFGKRKFRKAAELYERACLKDSKDLQAWLRMGDAWVRAGYREKAVEAYWSATQNFARQGFVPRAIAAGKLVLELHPGHADVQRMLAHFYAKKQSASAISLLPAEPPSPPLDSALAIGEAPLRLEILAEAAIDYSAQLPAELERRTPSFLEKVERAADPNFEAESNEGPEVELSFQDIVPATSTGLPPKIPLFSDLTEAAFVELLQRCALRRFDAGERIIRQGDLGDSFFAICCGSVRVVREELTMTRALAHLGEGSFFGEVALLSGSPRTASVYAVSEHTQLLEISAAVLAETARQYPQVALALKKFCRQRLLRNLTYSSPLLTPFEGEQLKPIIDRFVAREAKRGECLIREGTPADGLYVVVCGEVWVQKGATHVALLKEGDVFGEISLLTKGPATASVVTTRRTSLLHLPRRAFDELILSHPQILVLVSELNDQRREQLQRLTLRPHGAAELLV